MHTIDIKLDLHADGPAPGDFERCRDWIVAVPENLSTRSRGRLPHLELLLDRRGARDGGDADHEPFVTDLPNAAGTRTALAVLDREIPEFDLLTLGRKLAAVAVQRKAAEVGVAVHGFSPGQAERVAEALIAALCAAAAVMPSFKKKAERPALKSIHVYGASPRHRFRRTVAEAEGNALARYLSSLPPNRLTPGEYLKEIRRLARKHKWSVEFIGTAALRRKKAGAFLAVVQGSPVADAGIARVRYSPPGGRGSRTPALVLAGKGICYDTGGTNLKPAKFMYGMHGDMQGSAVALGVLHALSAMKFPHPVECWLALAMNHIGPKAYKPNDVVSAADGTSIEVIHTDAEGRMVLADTLVLASRTSPRLIVDYATLTGACVYSLGDAYSGIFSNRAGWTEKLIRAGRDSGERVWPFPMDADYDKGLESGIADVKQCAAEGNADHILAARFLQRFVGADIPWIHLDLASSNRKGGLAHIPTEMTGFGVRYTLALLLDQKILSSASG